MQLLAPLGSSVAPGEDCGGFIIQTPCDIPHFPFAFLLFAVFFAKSNSSRSDELFFTAFGFSFFAVEISSNGSSDEVDEHAASRTHPSIDNKTSKEFRIKKPPVIRNG
jgi:hypothetical protein